MSNLETKINPSLKLFYFIIGLFVTVGAILFYTSINNYMHPLVCVNESKVVDILTLEGREAKIKLENGNIIKLHGAFLKQGDTYCLKYENSK